VIGAIVCFVLGLAAGPAQDPAVPGISVGARPPLLQRLIVDKFFSKLPLRAVADFAPLDLALQEPYGAPPGWVAAHGGRFGPWMRELAAQFEQHFVEPFALERHERFGAPGVVVLATEGDLLNFRRSEAGRRSASFGEACYDPALDVVVVTAASSERAPHLARFGGLTMLVYRELAAHSADGVRRPPWLHWGLGAYLAWNTGFAPDSLRKREIDRTSLTDWVLAGQTARNSGRTLLPLLDLVAAADAEGAAAAVRRGAEATQTKLEHEPSYLAWTAACLWTHYLVDGDGGRWRDGYGAYLASCLGGRGDGQALREALQLDDAGWSALEQGFEAWTRSTALAMGLIATTDPIPATAAGSAAAPTPEPPPLPPLPPQPQETALAHGLALVLAREGDLDGAIALLERVSTAAPENERAQRAARDLERARGFRELRARFLGGLAASGKLLQLERDGKRLNVRVAAVEPTRITLREAKGGLDAVPFAQMPSFGLARQMERDAGWLRAWPYALAGDERAANLLDAKDPAAAALRADAAEAYPALLRLGGVARELGVVGTGELPADALDCELLAQRCAALARDSGDLAEVAARRASLRARAAAALERSWDPERMGEGLAARLESLPQGRARLTYTFDLPTELDELQVGSLYPPQRAAGQPALLRAPQMAIDSGALRASGSHTWRLPLPFRAPLSVRLQFTLGEVPDGATTFVNWSLGACDDGQGNLVLVEGLGELLVIDLPAGVSTSAIDTRTRSLDRRRYTLELRHDGASASSWLEGQPCKQLAAATRTAGDVFFSMHADTPLGFEELVVEGELDLDLARQRWLQRRLAALGF
jgi:hypothetical protein